MTTRTITTPHQRDQWAAYLAALPLPLTVTVVQGKKRSDAQNRMQRKWCLEVAEQMPGWTPEDVRAYSKLHFGVRILRAENEDFCTEYDAIIRPLPYEMKLRLMAVPLDFSVTRLMTVKQKAAYLDAMHQHWTAMGVILTEPDPMEG